MVHTHFNQNSRPTVVAAPGSVHGEVEQADAAENMVAYVICASPAQDGPEACAVSS